MNKFLYKAFREGRIKQLSENMFKVDNHLVKIQTKKGRKLITCDCENHTTFCNSPVLCWHKELTILFQTYSYFHFKLSGAINFLEMNKKLCRKLNELELIELLKSIKYIYE